MIKLLKINNARDRAEKCSKLLYLNEDSPEIASPDSIQEQYMVDGECVYSFIRDW